MRILLLLSLLSVPVFAQKAIEPVRVSLALAAENPSASDLEFNDRLREEFNRLRLAITTRRGDYDITVATTRITVEGKPKGYACAVLIMDAHRRFRLSVETGSSLLGMAQDLATYLDKEYFQTKRRGNERGR